VIAAILLATVQCSRRQLVSPEAAYQSIEQRFISGDLEQAEAESLRASSVAAVNGPRWIVKFRIQQARILVYQGRYRDALVLLRPPLPAGALDQPLELTRSALLSIALGRTGDREHAEGVLAEAERMCPNELACVEVRLARGIVDIESAQLEDANKVFEIGLNSARACGDKFLQMQALLNLGVVALRQEHYDDALDRFAAASVLANAIGARVALEKANGNVGWALYKLGDYRRALASSQRAGEQAAVLGIPVDQVRWFNDSGLSQYQLGDLSAARSSYERSLQLARSIHNPEEIGDALVALASLSLKMGGLDDALNRAREAQQIAEGRGNSADALRPLLIEALALEKQGKFFTARAELITLQQRSAAKPSLRWEVENALAQLAAESGDARAADSWFQRAIGTFREQRASVAGIDLRLPFVENGVGLYLSYMEFLIGENKQEEALRILDESRAETLSEGLLPDAERGFDVPSAGSNDASSIARRLNATILVYCLRPGRSYLWAIAPHHLDFIRLPGEEVILPLIDRFTRAVMSSSDVLVQQNTTGYALYHELVEPAHSLIAPGSKVFIIADQEMNGLNFETLPTSSMRPHFWIEDVDIVNARSLSLLATKRPRPQVGVDTKRLLLIGDPIYNNAEYERLPHAQEEMTEIAGHFLPSQRRVVAGADATPTAYEMSTPGKFSYIHFVAHGVANSNKPLDSAVVLSSSSPGGDSYKLYARTILDYRLNADLVTISSCYGSGVQAYSGEGLVGLTWAFLRAGSHNVIGALWEVSDVSTPRLMNNLYDGLMHGDSPSNALRAAKLAMIHGGGVFRKPFYWAPFQLYAGS
jgi:CHAT domain-containing protein/tetratricopeptide (TPR) repeat protein